MRDLDALASQARGYLVDKGCARSTITHHGAAWKRLMSWCEDEGIGGHGHDVERRFIEEVVMANADATRYLGLDKSRVLLLLSIDETGEPPDREARRRFVVPAGFDAAYLAYAAELEERGLRASTREGYPCGARDLCEGCGATRPGQLDARPVGVFAEAVSHCAPQTRSARPCVARDFTRLPAGVGACGPEVAAAVPHIPGHRHSTVPSAYPAAEVSTMSGSFPRSLRPRRDRAMMLLASVLGMRAGDIKALRLSDIDWRAKTVSFVQRKTQVANALHMPEEVWLAVADHVRCERPDVDGDRVLAAACAPYHAIDSSHTSRGTVTRAFADAGVETAGKHHGTRGPAAGDMPPGGTPYPTISSVLGHSSANVTKRYLSIDVESLRPPAPGVPSCPWGPGSREGAPRPWGPRRLPPEPGPRDAGRPAGMAAAHGRPPARDAPRPRGRRHGGGRGHCPRARGGARRDAPGPPRRAVPALPLPRPHRGRGIRTARRAGESQERIRPAHRRRARDGPHSRGRRGKGAALAADGAGDPPGARASGSARRRR